MSGEDALPIVQCGDPVLRRQAEPVDPAELRSGGLRRLIAQMRATEDERAARGRTALPFTVLANAVVTPIEADGLVGFYEGCLSVPALTAVVARHRAVRVEALDSRGQPVDRVFSGWAARIVQHEVDHLGGRLYLDRVETRSLSTVDNYARLWAGRPPGDAAACLGFALE
jgi:peptide deformylase